MVLVFPQTEWRERRRRSKRERRRWREREIERGRVCGWFYEHALDERSVHSQHPRTPTDNIRWWYQTIHAVDQINGVARCDDLRDTNEVQFANVIPICILLYENWILLFLEIIEVWDCVMIEAESKTIESRDIHLAYIWRNIRKHMPLVTV